MVTQQVGLKMSGPGGGHSSKSSAHHRHHKRRLAGSSVDTSRCSSPHTEVPATAPPKVLHNNFLHEPGPGAGSGPRGKKHAPIKKQGSRASLLASSHGSHTPAHESGASSDEEDRLSPWQTFVEHINSITCDGTMMFSAGHKISIKQPSVVYKKVMIDVRNAEQKAAAAAAAAAAREAAAAETGGNSEQDKHLQEEVEEEEEEPLTPQQEAARRAWNIIRKKVAEIGIEQRKKGTTLNWSFLRQHISNMSDMQRTRQELYNKYLFNPRSWAEGLSRDPAEILATIIRPQTISVNGSGKSKKSTKRSTSRQRGKSPTRSFSVLGNTRESPTRPHTVLGNSVGNNNFLEHSKKHRSRHATNRWDERSRSHVLRSMSALE